MEAYQQDSTPKQLGLSEETPKAGGDASSAAEGYRGPRRRNEKIVRKDIQFEHQFGILVVPQSQVSEAESSEQPSSGVFLQGEILTLCELFDRCTGETLNFSYNRHMNRVYGLSHALQRVDRHTNIISEDMDAANLRMEMHQRNQSRRLTGPSAGARVTAGKMSVLCLTCGVHRMFTTDSKVAECAAFHVSSSIALSLATAGAGDDARFRKCIGDVFISNMVINDANVPNESPESDQRRFIMEILEMCLPKDDVARPDWDGHRRNIPHGCVCRQRFILLKHLRSDWRQRKITFYNVHGWSHSRVCKFVRGPIVWALWPIRLPIIMRSKWKGALQVWRQLCLLLNVHDIGRYAISLLHKQKSKPNKLSAQLLAEMDNSESSDGWSDASCEVGSTRLVQHESLGAMERAEVGMMAGSASATGAFNFSVHSAKMRGDALKWAQTDPKGATAVCAQVWSLMERIIVQKLKLVFL